jgi:transposase
LTLWKQLHEAAENSIGISEGKQSIVFEIEHLIGRIEAEDQFIDSLEKQMRIYLQQIPYSQNILSIKGLGEVTVAGLIGEVADFNKFDTISEVMKLAGLDLYEISSGNHRGQRRISKRGRPLMRKLLFFAAINAVKSKGIMHAKYQLPYPESFWGLSLPSFAITRSMWRTTAITIITN